MADIEPRKGTDAYTPELIAQMTEGERTLTRLSYFPASGESLQLFEIRLEPDATIQPHAHDASEIIFVLEGELRLGAQVAGPNTAVFVDDWTLYGFRSGPSGCRFLNFRGSAEGAIWLSKDDFMRARRGLPTEEGATRTSE